MAITESVGYEGTVGYDTYAQTVTASGRYTVDGASAWRVTETSGDRQVEVAAGVGRGYGIRDTSTATVLQHNIVASGVRHDLVVCRRDWSAGTSSFESVVGGASAVLPSRTTGPGVVDEQPLALVRITAGSTEPEVVADLRCWAGDGGLVAVHSLALDYLQEQPGTRVTIGDLTYTRILSPAGAASWDVARSTGSGLIAQDRLGPPTGLGSPPAGLVAVDSGWSTLTTGYVSAAWRFGPLVNIRLYLRKASGAAIEVNSSGNLTDTRIGTLGSAFRPRGRQIVPFMYKHATGQSTLGGTAFIETTGSIILASGAPNTTISNRPASGGYTVVIGASWLV